MKSLIKNFLCLIAALPVAQAGTVILGNTTGNTRGEDVVDIQPARDVVAQVASGYGTIVVGSYTEVSGDESSAFGLYNVVNGPSATAVGLGNTVSALMGVYDYYQHSPSGAFGSCNTITSSGDGSYAFGGWNTVGASYSSAFGHSNMVNVANATVFGFGITNNTAGSTMIGPSNTAKVTILSSGFVGVGLGTTNPVQMLDVGGNIRLTGNIIKAGTGGGTLTLPSGSGTLVATSGNQSIVGTTTLGGASATQQVKIDGTTGNVGIGSASTTNKLTVVGGASIDSTGTKAAPTNGLYVEGSVGVGITTTTPAAKLDVNGTVQIAGDMRVKNHAVIRFSPAGDIDMGTFVSGTNPE